MTTQEANTIEIPKKYKYSCLAEPKHIKKAIELKDLEILIVHIYRKDIVSYKGKKSEVTTEYIRICKPYAYSTAVSMPPKKWELKCIALEFDDAWGISTGGQSYWYPLKGTEKKAVLEAIESLTKID